MKDFLKGLLVLPSGHSAQRARQKNNPYGTVVR